MSLKETVERLRAEGRIVDGATCRGRREVRAQVAIVGTGAGGAVCARELAERGIDTIVLEEGDYHVGADYGPLTPLASARMLYRDHGLTATLGRPPIVLPLGRCVGGTTVINSGTSRRVPEEAFARAWIPAGISGLGWPEMERLYRRVEALAHVGMVEASVQGRNMRLFELGARRLGLHGEPLTRGVRGCRGCGRCFLGCPEDAKQATHVSYVPQALAAGARLFTRARARRVVVADGRVRGVEAHLIDAADRRVGDLAVRADRVVVACGAVLSPSLLWASGVARANRHAGRHLAIHPCSRVVAEFDEEVDGARGVPQGYHVDDRLLDGVSLEGIFVPPGLLAPSLPGAGRRHLALMQEYRRLAIVGVRIVDESRGRVLGSIGRRPVIAYWQRPADVRRLLEGFALGCEVLLAAGARRCWVAIHGHEEVSSPSAARALASMDVSPWDIEQSAYHPHGTLRMAGGADDGVVREDGQVHGVSGLHVADASIFPASSYVNPQLTIMALATFVSEAVADGLGARGQAAARAAGG